MASACISEGTTRQVTQQVNQIVAETDQCVTVLKPKEVYNDCMMIKNLCLRNLS